MFRDMRRSKQLMSRTDTETVLEKNTSGVLALSGDDDYPYAVPISYAWVNNKLYFHCAQAGHKVDSVRRNCKASFCVIDKDTIIPEKFTTYFRSVIVFGKIRFIEDENDKRAALEFIAKKYSPHAAQESVISEIDGALGRVCIMELIPDHITGKEAIELVNQKLH